MLFTPTIPHCSMATLIGLSIRVRLLRALPRRFKVEVGIYPGTHASRDAGERTTVRRFSPPTAHGRRAHRMLCGGFALSARGYSTLTPRPVPSIRPYFDAVNKQLADKERVAAALENTHLLEVRIPTAYDD